jgi:hypothetical protein
MIVHLSLLICLIRFFHFYVFGRPESLGIVVAVVFMVLTIVFQFLNFAPDSNVRIFDNLLLQFFYTMLISLLQILCFHVSTCISLFTSPVFLPFGVLICEHAVAC